MPSTHTAASRPSSIPSTSSSSSQTHRRTKKTRSYALATLSILATATCGTLGVASAATSASFPSIDFDALGAVGVAGSFSGLEVWSQAASSLNPANAYTPGASTVIERSSNGTLTQINATEPGGTIQTVCGRSAPPGTVFVGGNFTQIANVKTRSIASYDPGTRAWDAMAGGLNGTVTSLLCMDDLLLAGGDFTGPVTMLNTADSRYRGNVAAWNYTSKAWQPLDFGGLNGTVHTMAPGANSSNVRFGGQFETQFGNVGINGSLSGTNTSATSLSDKWAPVSLGMSLFEGGPASRDASFAEAPQILCPKGPDGAGNTYLFRDNTAGALRVSLYQKVHGRAFRLGNTFHQGRGTQNFSITSLPDNKVLELLYLDPETKKNVTCTTNCQLYHSAQVPYQDFLVTNATANDAPGGIKEMSGFIFSASTWYGAGAGLHILELLSDGGWARAYDAYNRGSCASPEIGVNGTGSGSTNEGGWYTASLPTQWGGVPDNVMLLTDAFSNLARHTSAKVSWNIDVAVAGNYSVYLHVPGCDRADQCDQRTDVIVTVMNNSTNPGTARHISQNVQTDTDVLVWEGPVQPTSRNFMPSVVLSIPSNATAPSGRRFTVVADRVRFELRNSNQTYQMDQAAGFGLLEYDILDPPSRALNVNATGSLPAATLTDFSSFGITLAKNGIARNQSEWISSISSLKDLTFVGGNFSSDNFTVTGANPVGFRNIVAYNTTQNATAGVAYTRLANGGVNAPVTSLMTVGDFLFVGGSFTGLADSSAETRYIARYDPVAKVWAALSGGPDGPVTSLSLIGRDGLVVSGNFSTLGSTRAVGGFAIWNTTTNTWNSEAELLIGQVSSVSVVNGTAYLVGSIDGMSANAASGVAGIDPPQTDGMPPQIKILDFAFKPPASSTASAPSSTSSSTNASATSSRSSASIGFSSPTRAVSDDDRRSDLEDRGLPSEAVTQRGARVVGSSLPALAERSSNGTPLWRRLLPSALARTFVRRGHSSSGPFQSSSDVSSQSHFLRRADAMEPASLQSSGDNEVLASAFWQRADGSYMTVVGGNFTTNSGIQNLAIYDPNSTRLYAFPAAPTGNGVNRPTVIRALAVDNNILYAGGDGGLTRFDLVNNRWLSMGQSLTATGGSNLTVTAIAHKPDTTQIVVAGSFSAAGVLPCENVCSWDTSSQTWTPLGGGVQGQISTIDYAGSKASNLIAAGSLMINGVQTALASWDFNGGQSWTALGAIGRGGGQAPGPATAASVDDLNANGIFVAGRFSDGSQPYLAKWDGSSYHTLQASELTEDTGIAQLTFVPINKAHPSNGVLENNRLLVVSGALKMRSFGNVSSAFFDGQTWTPFLISTSSSGGPGVMRSFTRSTEVLKFPNLKHLAVGLVILISIAIGLGVVFLLVLLGLLAAVARRRPNRGVDVPISPSDELLASDKKRPSSLLATLNAATENVMGAGAAGVGAAGIAGATSSGHGRGDSVPMTTEGAYTSDPSTHYHSEGQTGRSDYYTDESAERAALAGGALGAGAGAAAGAAASSRDHGDEAGVEAHMRFSFEATHPSELGARAGDIVTILDDSDEHWWLARTEDGRVGVVPASYVL
ncbi:unnamed protein product [Parajaminaea phylloscopi]